MPWRRMGEWMYSSMFSYLFHSIVFNRNITFGCFLRKLLYPHLHSIPHCKCFRFHNSLPRHIFTSHHRGTGSIRGRPGTVFLVLSRGANITESWKSFCQGSPFCVHHSRTSGSSIWGAETTGKADNVPYILCHVISYQQFFVWYC
jgi:hypothetical protein